MALETNVGDVVSVRLEFADANANKAFNVLHYRLRDVEVPGGGLFAGEDFAAVAPGLAMGLGLALRTGWSAFASQDVKMTGVTVQNLHPLPKSAQYTSTFAAPFPGEHEDHALPLQDAPTLLKRTAHGSKWGIGRVFVVGLAEASQNAGIIEPGIIPTINAWATDLGDEFNHVVNGNTFHWRPCLFSGPLPNGGAPRILDFVQIVLSDNVLKTQRRRRPGKGI
jgi:hypothetical protein